MPFVCPACGKQLNDESVCTRCKCDVSDLIEIEQASKILYENACTLFKNGAIEKALTNADKSWFLFNNKETAITAFIASIMKNDFERSSFYWRQIEK